MLFFFKNIHTRAIQRLELQVLPKQLTTRLYFIMLQDINVFFIKDSVNYAFYLRAKHFLASPLWGKKKPTTTNPKSLLHYYYGATFPSPYFGFVLAVALQFSVINTDKKFWLCRIMHLYLEPKKTSISPKQLSLLLPKNCFRKSYFCLWTQTRAQHEADSNRDRVFCQQAEAVQVSGQADCSGRVFWRAL